MNTNIRQIKEGKGFLFLAVMKDHLLKTTAGSAYSKFENTSNSLKNLFGKVKYKNYL